MLNISVFNLKYFIAIYTFSEKLECKMISLLVSVGQFFKIHVSFLV